MSASSALSGDVEYICTALKSLPANWDGKKAISKLKEMDYNWRQMEWIGWYFEVLCLEQLEQHAFRIPGGKYGNVTFDCSKTVNWDIKASAIKSHNHKAILNDIEATEQSIRENGAHGLILALVDVEYNDDDRSFQKWHTELKGGLSRYEKKRIARNAVSRYRKRKADLKQILLLAINETNKEGLEIHAQGRNADGSPRNPKYMLDVEEADQFEIGRIYY